MKIYAAPEHIPAPDFMEGGKYDPNRYDAACSVYEAAVKQWLLDNGYTGKHTGEVIRFGVADGKAAYMFGDVPRSGVLIHLATADGYHYNDVQYLPKREIIERIEGQKRVGRLFGRKD